MSMPFFLMLFGGLLLGVVLLWLGLRGRRVNRHPVCRWCSFDLEGVYPASPTCPECGAGLKRTRAVRIGVRRRLWPVVLLAAPLILLPAATFGLAFFAAVTGSSLHAHLPLGVLLFQSGYASPAMSGEIASEVLARMKARSLSKAQYARAIEAALALQADQSRPWVSGWGAVIERARADGELSSAQDARYLIQAPTISITARDRVRPGDPIPVHLSAVSARLAPGETYTAMLWAPTIRLGQQRTWRVQPEDQEGPALATMFSPLRELVGYLWFTGDQPTGGGRFGGFGGLSGMQSAVMGVRCPEGAPPGTHKLEIELAVLLHDAQRGNTRRTFSTPKRDDPGVKWQTLVIDVEVLPAGQDTVQPIEPDEDARARLTRALRPYEANLWRGMGRTGRLDAQADWAMFHATLDLAQVKDIPVAFDVFLVHDSKRWRIGTVASEIVAIGGSQSGMYPASQGTFRTLQGNLPEFTDKTVDVLFVPSAEVARRTASLRSFYNGEILVKSVAVRRQSAGGLPIVEPEAPEGGKDKDATEGEKPAEKQP